MVAILAGPAFNLTHAADGDHSSAKKGGAAMPSMQMHKSMMGGMKEMHSMKMTGNVDVDFAMMMRKHHQGGLEMAQIEIKNGKDPQMKAMAQKIVDAQQKEIQELDAWLAKHKDAANPGAHKH